MIPGASGSYQRGGSAAANNAGNERSLQPRTADPGSRIKAAARAPGREYFPVARSLTRSPARSVGRGPGGGSWRTRPRRAGGSTPTGGRSGPTRRRRCVSRGHGARGAGRFG